MTMSGDYVATYGSAVDAAKQFGVSSASIIKCCRKTPHYLSYKGFKWMYLSEYEKIGEDNVK